MALFQIRGRAPNTREPSPVEWEGSRSASSASPFTQANLRSAFARALLPLMALVSVLGTTASAGAVTGPTLTLACANPNHRGIVNCKLSGANFASHERVHIKYHVVFIGEPKQASGPYPSEVIRRQARTGKHGHFVRPPMWFQDHPKDGPFRLRAAARGRTGDRAEVDFFGFFA